jgi:Polyketide cyclase / dehydrase and lipid transport.
LKRPVQPFWPTSWRRAACALVHTKPFAYITNQGSQSVVEWRGAFYRGYPNNDPPPDQNDEAAVKAISGVYKGGLENLKKLVEGS